MYKKECHWALSVPFRYVCSHSTSSLPFFLLHTPVCQSLFPFLVSCSFALPSAPALCSISLSLLLIPILVLFLPCSPLTICYFCSLFPDPSAYIQTLLPFSSRSRNYEEKSVEWCSAQLLGASLTRLQSHIPESQSCSVHGGTFAWLSTGKKNMKPSTWLPSLAIF